MAVVYLHCRNFIVPGHPVINKRAKRAACKMSTPEPPASPASLRALACELFRSNLKTKKHDGDTDVAVGLERECLAHAIRFSDARNFTCSWNNPRFRKLYANTVRNVAVALNRRDDVRRSVLSGAMRPEELVGAKPQDLFPDAWRASIAAHAARMVHAYETRVHAKTTQFQCPKCKNVQCDFYELQCRSADESMSLFVTCLTCAHHWRHG
jgi:DNA-directed RNA polymerase subunit M/transcription elongation factor TFIIS